MTDTNLVKLTDKYLNGQHMMQLATSDNGRPWCCTVYYVHDDEHNLYWASVLTRRHSQELTRNDRAAVAIPIRFLKGEAVIGIQAEGLAAELTDTDEIRQAAERYARKFNRTPEWIEDIAGGRTEHRMYKLKPDALYLFDEVNYPDGQRRQVL